MTGEYGIVANVIETDRVLHKGTKVWVLGGWPGGGFERVTVFVATRSGRSIEKYVPIFRLGSFRAVWIPEHLRDKAAEFLDTKEKMTEVTVMLTDVADKWRVRRASRLEMQP